MFDKDVQPVNKPYDIAERSPQMSPMMECFVLLVIIKMSVLKSYHEK